MRKWLLLAAMFSPLALADAISVAAHSVLRLPNKSSVVHLQRLEVADSATLLLPASLVELKVDELQLGREARIAIVPADAPLKIEVLRASLGAGSEFAAHGAPGTYEKPARPGRNIELKVLALDATQLAVDARGGAGAPGYVGLDGANGKAGGCTWGQASRGANGDNGGNGHDGAAGGQVRLVLPSNYPDEQIKVRLEGGAPGVPGAAGKPGAGGASKGCLVYRTDAGPAGRPGAAGQPGLAGSAGELTVQRL
ncbi:collagen-like protein [Pseudomonas fontis]|uniref:Collagen-like protein n=1 Tax=Pseudomonas fontis TaxID=2942633 RepID=A0ABT5NWI7_9PSED|nr:collagen-like protein [Pseudomonas fontis]MDD0973467.1 collagen-like protein [Pseudomonas fontis]MDD0992552.1 collagen-like protein [Pseudomonas fontis]